MNNLTIPAYSEQAAQVVKERLDSLAKVPGNRLGKLEELAIRLAGITGRTSHPSPKIRGSVRGRPRYRPQGRERHRTGK